MDPTIWQPFVRHVAAMHGYDCRRISAGVPGTYPTFIAEVNQSGVHASQTIVVKFFGRLYEGSASFQVERAMGQLISQHPLPIHSPAILAEGSLNPEWSYILFEYAPGSSYGLVRDKLTQSSQEEMAAQLGRYLRALHEVTTNTGFITLLPGEQRNDFAAFIEIQETGCLSNHQRWQDLPAHLLKQLPGFVLPRSMLLDPVAHPHLMHADLTADHLLRRLKPELPPSTPPINLAGGMAATEAARGGREWESLSVIDWGDCRVGNILYELVAVHMDLFQGDKNLLSICLEAYGLPDFFRRDFARKAFSMVLLHQFPMPAKIYEAHRHVRTLEELAERLFGV